MAFSPRRGIASMVHAASASAALENLAAGLALEWSRFGIRTICIAAGTIATEALLWTTPRRTVPIGRPRCRLRRFGTADEVSGVIAFLASPAGAYVTGTTIVVDGGADAWGNGCASPPLVNNERNCRLMEFAYTPRLAELKDRARALTEKIIAVRRRMRT